MNILAASCEDARAIVLVLGSNNNEPSLYQRTEKDVRKHIREFVVAKDERGKILGCCALHRHSRSLGELCSLSILPEAQGRKLGDSLIAALHERARDEGLRRLCLTTSKPDYAARFGYRRISMWKLPIPVLLAKLILTLKQPVNRWLPSIFGRFTFMEKDEKIPPFEQIPS